MRVVLAPKTPSATAPDRPLSKHECLFVDRGILTQDAILKLPGVRLGSRSKIEKALRMTIRASPHLTNTVVGAPDGTDGKVFRYNAMTNEALWQVPNFVQVKEETEDDEALKMLKELHRKQFNEYQNSKEMRMTVPFRFNVCVTPTTTILGVVVTHHNMDGSGIWSFLTKFLLFARLPKAVWSIVFRMCKDKFPLLSYSDMLCGEETIPTLPKFVDTPILHFTNYDPSNPVASDFLVFHESLGYTEDVIFQCRQALKAKGVTISSAFTALSAKMMAHLSQYISSDTFVPGAIIGVSPIDLRKKDQWAPNRGGKKVRTSSLLPVVAHYSTCVRTAIPFDTLLQSTLEELALAVKRDVKDYQANPGQRKREDEFISPPGSVFCGVTSVVSPSPRAEKMMRLKQGVQITRAYNPPITKPTCWFRVITRGKETSVDFTLGLPGKALLREECIYKALQESVAGSALAPLFNKL